MHIVTVNFEMRMFFFFFHILDLSYLSIVCVHLWNILLWIFHVDISFL